jgi:predicted nucleic acid-binding protein
MEKNAILLDSNLLIAAFRKNNDAISFLAQRNFHFAISDITIMELFAGCKNIAKRKDIERILKFYARAPLSELIAEKAISLVKRYAVTPHSIHLPDILIAATAMIYKLPLKTLNKKDFDFIKEIELI